MARPAIRLHYDGLDFIRGVAAICVLFYHTDFMFGLTGALLPNGYLAVDLFFILSGFVIACTYEAALQQGRIGLAAFGWRRIARLYPLYLVTMLAGLVVNSIRYKSHAVSLDVANIVKSALLNLFMIPTFYPVYEINLLYPFNPASWSIFYELFINVIFAVALARMPTRSLALVWVLSACLLTFVVSRTGTLDIGWNAANFLEAFPRVVLSFTTGMLLWRWQADRPGALPGVALAAMMVGCVLAFQHKLWAPEGLQGACDLVAAFVLLPATAAVGARYIPAGDVATLSRLLGETSYAIYLIQGPMILVAAGLVQAASRGKIADYAPIGGILFVPTVIALSYCCYRWFEMPARRSMRALRPAAASA